MNKLLFNIRMYVFTLIIRLAMFVVPKNATETFKWLLKIPLEEESK